MKPLITLSIILFCWFTTFHSFAQVSAYTFMPLAGTFTEITVSGGATQLSLSGGSLDDGWYNNIPTGFNFVFDGVNYSALSAGTDGFLLLGANLSSALTSNNLTSGTPRPKLAPLWDDIEVGSSGSFRYVTTGTTGSKVFTAQWLMMYWNYSASTASVSFQVKLYESSNKIEFIYRQEAASPISSSASIGISGTNTGSGNFLSINDSGINPAVSSSTETTTISTTPATGQTYRFSPPGPVFPNCADTPNPPSGVTITPSILCWSDGGGNASGFKLYLDTINPPTMLVQDSTIFCYTLSTMSLNKTYYWKVVPYNVEGEASGCSVWNFTTAVSITGTVRYQNTDSTIIAFCKVILWDNQGNRIDSAYTSMTGSYSFTAVPLGTYHLTAHPNQVWGGINSNDALIVAKHYVHILTLTGLYKAAADVNGSNSINSLDALLIQKRFTLQISAFPIKDWISENKTATIATTVNQTINIRVISTGDVNGSFLPNNNGLPCPSQPTFTYGGQIYNTVQIGTQCIMKENLNIGTYVPSISGGSNHSDVSNNGIIEKYCYNNDQANCAIYGGLYDWNEMMQYSTTEGIQGICPAGWHIPTNAEWDTLVSFLGGSSVAGGKMKETGFVHWLSPNTGATNLSGFTAFGDGIRTYYGSFLDLQYYAYFWSSSQYSSSNAWFRYLGYDYTNVGQLNYGKTLGYSLRCFKD